ncbi:hypothetical protein [Bacillus solitudinis]|uniref:hypothetical protein n=1 Tax=Bacillus solitudinis TaxID=2014074 RepID=UPI000C244717|nr:hypothetical protein [Bacillus solitudinis]
METFKDYIEQQVKHGYLDKTDLEPLKCQHCDSKNLEDTGFIVEELGTHVTTEYKKVCKDCNKEVGYWAYGNWQI